MDSALRGLLGELKTLARLSVGKTDLSLQCISNFPIKGDNTYYQVDAIIVCTKGVFCLEVKNWSCILICNSGGNWLARYPTEDISVKSPVAQNQAHRDRIQRITHAFVHSYILFSGHTTLINNPDNVLNVEAFVPLLKTLPDALAVSEIEEITEQLKAYKKAIEPNMLVDFVFKQATRRVHSR